MKKLVQFLFLFMLLTACKKDPICKTCQQFLGKDKLFKYEEQRFSYADYMIGPNGIMTYVDSRTFKKGGKKHIIEKNQLENIRDSLFCFTNMPYVDVVKYIPSTADSLTLDSIGKTYTLELVLNVGHWGAKNPDKDYTDYIGLSSLKFRFRKEKGEFIFVGSPFDPLKFERCIDGK